MTGLRLAIVFALALPTGLGLGCDRGIEPYVPGEKPEPPDLARIFPEGATRARQNEAGAQPAGAAGGRGAPSVAAEVGEPIRGTLRVAPELADRVPSRAVLFLIARRGEAGPPLAVKRIEDARFPLRFELGPSDRMIEAIPFAGPLQLTARLDADGNAMTQGPGDLEGVVPGTVEPGANDVELWIDQAL